MSHGHHCKASSLIEGAAVACGKWRDEASGNDCMAVAY